MVRVLEVEAEVRDALAAAGPGRPTHVHVDLTGAGPEDVVPRAVRLLGLAVGALGPDSAVVLLLSFSLPSEGERPDEIPGWAGVAAAALAPGAEPPALYAIAGADRSASLVAGTLTAALPPPPGLPAAFGAEYRASPTAEGWVRRVVIALTPGSGG